MSARLLAAAEALFLCAIVVAPWPYGSAADVARFSLTAVLLAAGAAWAVARALAGQGVPWLAVLAALLPAIGLLQLTVGATAARISSAEAVLVLAAMATALVFWADRARDRRAAVRLAAAILLSALAQAVFGVVQASTGADRIYGRSLPGITAAFGSFVNHNHFAGLMEMAALLAAGAALGRVRHDRGPSPAAVGLAGLTLALVAAHMASRSRGGVLALLAGASALAAGTWVAGPRRLSAARRLALAAGTVAALVGFGLAAVPEQTRRHLATVLQGTAQASGAYRVETARDTLRLALAHPVLGCGLGTFADAFPAFKRHHGDLRTEHAESDAAEWLAETGLLGLLALGALGVAIARALRVRLREGGSPLRKGLALGAAAGAFALMVHSLFDFNLRLPANALVFVSLLGLAAAPPAEPMARGGRAAAVATAVTLGLLALASTWRAAGAVGLQAALREGDGHRRLAALSAVLESHPYLAEGHRARGLAWTSLAWRPPSPLVPRLLRAQRDLEGALHWRPHWGLAWADLGVARQLAGDRAGAREAFDRAMVLDPTHLGIGLARAEFLSGEDPRAAVMELARLRRHNPQWPLLDVLRAAARFTREGDLLAGLTDGSPAQRAALEAFLREAR